MKRLRIITGIIAIACAGALAGAVRELISRSALAFEMYGASYEVLAPHWLYAITVAPFFFWMTTWSLADLPHAQRLLGAALRTCLVVALALALARLARTDETNRISAALLVDVSDSMPDEALAEAERWIDQVYARRGDHDLHVVAFARTAERLQPPDPEGSDSGSHASRDSDRGPQADTPRLRRLGKRGAATNLQAAVQLAYGLFPPNHLRRAVLLTDGQQTSGDIVGEATRAASLGVQLFARPSRAGVPPEIAVTELDVPNDVKVGQPFMVRAQVFASRDARARIRLYQGETLNGLDSIRELDLKKGTQEVAFRSIVRVPGPVTYRAALKPLGEDRFADNNSFAQSTIVPGRPAVLYVEGSRHANYLARALAAAELDVDVRSGRAIPSSLREMERFDFMILSDVPADQVSPSQIDTIERYVRDVGGGFLMAGGESGFGLGGWQGTRMERLLPVRMDGQRRRDQPTLALTLVIDRSGSMNGQKIELAKEAAKSTAGLLSSDDSISVVGFDAQPERIVRMQSASNRLRIARDISRLAARGGTAIFPALDAAYEDLSVTRARIKHVILLTDGQSPERGISELVQVMRAESITVSTVGLGADVNRALLQSVARDGGGRSYFTNDPHNVPRIFMKETSAVARSAAVEEYVRAVPVGRADFLKAVDVGSAPFLHGYVATREKPAPAQVVLQSELSEPLLARWRVGLGWSLAWTSDVKNRWAVEWVRWRGFSRFWAQLVREHMRRRRRTQLDMTVALREGPSPMVQAAVNAIDANDRFMNGLDSEVTIDEVGPTSARARRAQRKTEPTPMHQTAPGRYEARLPLPGYGSFVVRATHRRDGRVVAESTAQLAHPYPTEYSTVAPDLRPLREAVALSNGTVNPTTKKLLDAGDETIRAHEELWPKMLFLALGLFLLDLLLRRVRLTNDQLRVNRT